jgi:hypothetical protein
MVDWEIYFLNMEHEQFLKSSCFFAKPDTRSSMLVTRKELFQADLSLNLIRRSDRLKPLRKVQWITDFTS